MHFYLKRQVVYLENKNVMYFILPNFKLDRKVLGNKFSKLNFRDLREISTHVQQLLREVALVRFFKYRLFFLHF